MVLKRLIILDVLEGIIFYKVHKLMSFVFQKVFVVLLMVFSEKSR